MCNMMYIVLHVIVYVLHVLHVIVYVLHDVDVVNSSYVPCLLEGRYLPPDPCPPRGR